MTRESDEKLVTSMLDEVGIDVSSGQAIGNLSRSRIAAIPVLLGALDVVTDRSVKEALVRELSVPEARASSVAARLLQEFESEGGDSAYAAMVGSALAVVADDSCATDLARLSTDARFGRARRGLVDALGRAGDRNVVPVLRGLLDDDDVVGPALGALRKRGVVLPATEIARFLECPSDETVRMSAGRMQDDFDEALVVSMLSDAGIDVESVWDIVNSSDPHVDAIPVLLRALDAVHKQSLSVREGIVRSLSIREARPVAASRLVREFEEYGLLESYGWAIGNALAFVADNSCTDDLVRLATDARFGTARKRVVDALARVGDESVVPALRQLLSDDDVVGPALGALRRRGVSLPPEDIARFLESPTDAMVRSEARKMQRLQKDQT